MNNLVTIVSAAALVTIAAVPANAQKETVAVFTKNQTLGPQMPRRRSA